MKTVQMTAADVAQRTARFDKLQAMSTLKDNPVEIGRASCRERV